MQPHPVSESKSPEFDFLGEVKAGFPSPAEGIREHLDLSSLLVRHKASTFFFRVDGVSMVEADMDEGDILIVDRALEPWNGCRAVCFLDGEFTVKTLEITENGAMLRPANPKYKPIPVGPENNFSVWGVVTWVIKKCTP